MPTGYAAAIEEGCTFEEFVLRCARAFGACATLRDEPMDQPIPENLKATTYHLEKLIVVQRQLRELDRLTTEDIEHRIRQEREQAESDNREYLKQHQDKKLKYFAMAARVEAWEPPSLDHIRLKMFMLEQIRESIPRDPCYQRDLPIAEPAAWRETQRQLLTEDCRYHEDHWRQELERTKSHNEWIRLLRESLRDSAR